MRFSYVLRFHYAAQLRTSKCIGVISSYVGEQALYAALLLCYYWCARTFFICEAESSYLPIEKLSRYANVLISSTPIGVEHVTSELRLQARPTKLKLSIIQKPIAQ